MVGPAAASPFAERPTSSSKPAVVVVCVRHLSISFLGYPSAVVQLTPSLTKILVGGNELGDEGTTILCDALRESTVSKVEELNLSNNEIGPNGAKAIAALCVVAASLMKLDARFNSSMGEEGEAALRKAVEGRSGFKLEL